MLKNGMTASIDIQTRRRSIMSYLTKPLHKAFGGALNER
jgi:multidrug efflux pump subunit AcrA (membrane-fusion protein)